MKSKEYIFKNLRELVARFPQIKFRYQFDELEQTHIVEVTPLEVFEDDQNYKIAEGDLTFEFDRTFSPETVMFVSEHSLTRITNPEKVFRKEDQVVWEFYQDLLTGKELISEFEYLIHENEKSFNVDQLNQEEFNFSTDLPETENQSESFFSQLNNFALAA